MPRSTPRPLPQTLAVAALLLLPLVPSADAASAPGRAKPVTLRGQVACSVCWFEADREKVAYGNAADLECAARCAKEGIAPLLAVGGGSGVELWLLEGEAPRAGWLALTGRQAEATGVPSERGGKHVLRVTSARLAPPETAPSPVPGGAPEAAGAADAADLDLELKDLDGKPRRLSELRGKIVVLNFWATWCAPCRAEMPVLASVGRDRAKDGVVVLGAAGDGTNSTEAVRRFAAEHKIDFPIWLGANASDLRVFGLGPAIPATAIVDRNGRVAWRTEGVVDAAQLLAHIDAVVALPRP